MEPLIKCEHVDLGYENQDAVINVNMEVCSGDYLCIVGENGSGKSTLIKGLLGLLKPSGGKLTVAEGLKTTGIGYLPQQTASQKDFPASVREVVLSGCLSRRGRRPFYSQNRKRYCSCQYGKTGYYSAGRPVLQRIVRRTAAESADRQSTLRYQGASYFR